MLHIFLMAIVLIALLTLATLALIRHQPQFSFSGSAIPLSRKYFARASLRAALIWLYVAVKNTAGGELYRTIWYGPTEVGVTRQIDPSSFKTTGLVDADGYLIPGTVLEADFTPVNAADQVAAYIVAYPTKVAEGNTDTLLDASPNQNVGLNMRGQFLRENIEFNLGRVLSANELAAIAANPRFTLV